MNQSPTEQRAVPVKGIWAIFFGSLSLIPLSLLLGRFDTATELMPTHDSVAQTCFAVAAVSGLLTGGVGIFLTGKLTIIQRIMLPLVFTFVTAIGVFLVTDHISSIVKGRLDFPAGKTHKRQVLFQISRAYRTHGNGASQYIQTMPIWSNLEIESEDFAFMQSNRRPGEDGHSPDEISSRGYFCAKVSIEETDKALRILNAGSQKLPTGTVILCPIRPTAP